MSLLVVGSVAFDALETPFGKVDRTLGGAATYFSVAASAFTRVNLVGVVGTDFTVEDENIFKGRRIDLSGLERAEGKTFFWAGRYGVDPNDRLTLTTELNVFSTFRPRIPERFRQSRHIFLANIDPTLQRSVLEQIDGTPHIVGLDTMNYWIENTPDELRQILRHTSILMINDAETRMLANEHNLLRAARHIFSLGPTTLVIKRGEYGALMVHKDWIFSVPALLLEEVHDPTGAGDSFAGGFMGYLATVPRVTDAALRRAMVYGSVMGSFAVERFGLERLRHVTKKDINSRARHFAALTQFQL
jgi:sugar/nucleoside kinase (ribokinase family)